MKKLLVAILVVSFVTSPAFASHDDGGKKKARNKARVENKQAKPVATKKSDAKVCEIKNCDPKSCDLSTCDPKNCDPKNCDMQACPKDQKCTPSSSCGGNQ